MREQINRRFDFNIKRVERLISVYEELENAESDQPTKYRTDVLRAAVVFLHAALEDLLREAILWKLPDVTPKRLRRALHDRKRASSINVTLQDMEKMPDSTLKEQFVKAGKPFFLEDTYSDIKAIERALTLIGLEHSVLGPHKADLEAAIKRRHAIVHQGDRGRPNAKKHGSRRTLKQDLVKAWLESVKSFGKSVLSKLK